ncbi:hypothetical protein [Muriicola soli]|uniref:Uncharacterized protein n=1 Tax=Muriicola soli TaxID=2507538 RepID=A0A411EAQ9_9FLAO|nr:hypothetical protein [Muriicola soli]QBA64759.1 hypothetical protein EQY75_09610 [Muriicola soli]
MKHLMKISILILIWSLVITSCRKEESEFIQGPQEQALKANSAVANLLQRTAMKDGSDDNIVDQANCISLEFPFTVVVNGMELTVNSEEDLDTVEDILDEFDDDDDTIEIEFPITIILNDFSEVLINSLDVFEDYLDDCEGENEYDDDIECIDIAYPITVTIFDTNNEIIDTITINNDRELYFFIDELDDDKIVNVEFPITLILSDGTEISVSNLEQLEDVIDEAEDDCDEDDDYDYNDDDCDTCTSEQLSAFVTGCDNWYVKDFERNDMDLDEQYEGYTFTFLNDGTLTANTSTESFPGTWSASGSANAITVTINIPDLPDFNDEWLLHELDQDGDEREVDLRLPNDDELEFRSSCNP